MFNSRKQDYDIQKTINDIIENKIKNKPQNDETKAYTLLMIYLMSIKTITPEFANIKMEFDKFYWGIKDLDLKHVPDIRNYIFEEVSKSLLFLKKNSTLKKSALDKLESLVAVIFADNLSIQFDDFVFAKKLGKGNFGQVNLYTIKDKETLELLQSVGLIAPNSNSIAVKVNFTKEEDYNNEAEIARRLYLAANSLYRDGKKEQAPMSVNINFTIPAIGEKSEKYLLSRYETEGSGLEFLASAYSMTQRDQNNHEVLFANSLNCLFMLQDIWNGMQQIHKAGVIHGDLHLANTLMDEVNNNSRPFVTKIADFGLSKLMNDFKNQDLPTDVNNDPRHFQVKRVNVERYDGQLSIATDLYSYKLIVLESLVKIAGLDLNDIIRYVINPKEIYDIYRNKDNYDPAITSNINDYMLQLIKNAVRENLKHVKQPAARVSEALLQEFDKFLTWEKDQTPTQQMDTASVDFAQVLTNLSSEKLHEIVSIGIKKPIEQATQEQATQEQATQEQANTNNTNSSTTKIFDRLYAFSPNVYGRSPAENPGESGDSHTVDASQNKARGPNPYAYSPETNIDVDNSTPTVVVNGPYGFSPQEQVSESDVNNNNNNNSEANAKSKMNGLLTQSMQFASVFGRDRSKTVVSLSEAGLENFQFSPDEEAPKTQKPGK